MGGPHRQSNSAGVSWRPYPQRQRQPLACICPAFPSASTEQPVPCSIAPPPDPLPPFTTPPSIQLLCADSPVARVLLIVSPPLLMYLLAPLLDALMGPRLLLRNYKVIIGRGLVWYPRPPIPRYPPQPPGNLNMMVPGWVIIHSSAVLARSRWSTAPHCCVPSTRVVAVMLAPTDVLRIPPPPPPCKQGRLPLI